MKNRKYRKAVLVVVCLVLCMSGCLAESKPQKPYNSGGDSDDKTPTPAHGISSGTSTGGSIVSGSAVSTGSSISTGSAVDGTVSPAAIEDETLVTKEQKDKYLEISCRMKKIYKKIKKKMNSVPSDDTVYEDYRYFRPLYEYYCGLEEEDFEGISRDEMEEVIMGLEEYLEEMKKFAGEHNID